MPPVPRADQTARAAIRDEAMRLFAQHGPDAVTIRQIAAAAGVSPALVVHHFGTKQRLRAAVDDHVAGMFDEMFAAAEDPAATDWTGPQAGGSVAEILLRTVPPGSPVPAYLRRLLLSGDSAGRALFQRWYAAGLATLGEMERAGRLRPSADPAVRAAFLMANDLALILLHDHLSDALGIDPLSPDGVSRWVTEALAVYRDGVFASDPHHAQEEQ
jgi:AcrR family transcriptional regulator